MTSSSDFSLIRSSPKIEAPSFGRAAAKMLEGRDGAYLPRVEGGGIGAPTEYAPAAGPGARGPSTAAGGGGKSRIC